MPRTKKLVNQSTETTVKCPICGAEFAIPEHEQVVQGTAIGKDSGLGTVYLPLAGKKEEKPEKKSKAQLRIEAMQAAGIDTSKYFAIRGADGKEESVGRIVDGHVEIVEDNDPIVKKIVASGSLLNSHLFKQHVLSQTLHMLTKKVHTRSGLTGLLMNYRGEYNLENFHTAMVACGYDYTWDVLNDEFMRQSAMKRHGDTVVFAEDHIFYNQELAVIMMDDYLAQLKQLFSESKTRMFNGKPYIKFRVDPKLVNLNGRYGYVFVEEEPKIIKAIEAWRKKIARTYDEVELHHILRDFCAIRPKLRQSDTKSGEDFKAKQCKEWQDAYKGYGAYFSMQNLIRFHGCLLSGGKVEGKDVLLTKEQSLHQLRKYARENKGYWLMGLYKEFLRYNHFNITATLNKWFEEKCK